MAFFKKTHKLTYFFNTGQYFDYRKGEIILRDGDIPSGVYYIVEGFVKVYSLNLDGSENLHVILKPGEVFPRNWIFDKAIEHVSFEALTQVKLRRKPKEAFVAILDTDTEMLREAFKISLDFIDVLLNRIENLEFTSSYPRVINRLLLLAKRLGERNGNEVRFTAPITHTNIANSINMSRETASRELEKLKKKHIIVERNHLIIIKDITRLEQELVAYFQKK
jgi:CRP-like cAMP-binding protein